MWWGPPGPPDVTEACQSSAGSGPTPGFFGGIELFSNPAKNGRVHPVPRNTAICFFGKDEGVPKKDRRFQEAPRKQLGG